MKETALMIYKKVLENRLSRKKSELAEIERLMNSANEVTANDKRKFIELKAILRHLKELPLSLPYQRRPIRSF